MLYFDSRKQAEESRLGCTELVLSDNEKFDKYSTMLKKSFVSWPSHI